MTVSVPMIRRLVAEAFGVTEAELLSSSRKRRVVEPRQIAIWFARKHTRASTHRLAGLFRRHQSTVCASLRVVDQRMGAPRLAAALARLEAAIRRASNAPQRPVEAISQETGQ